MGLYSIGYPARFTPYVEPSVLRTLSLYGEQLSLPLSGGKLNRNGWIVEPRPDADYDSGYASSADLFPGMDARAAREAQSVFAFIKPARPFRPGTGTQIVHEGQTLNSLLRDEYASGDNHTVYPGFEP